jgi:hypothetical protein
MALQQIANTDISSTGTFALGSVSSSALTSGRVTFATAGGLLTDSASLTYDGTTLTSTKFAGALNGTVGATTPSTVVATSITNSGLTSGRITYASTGGLLVDSSNLTFNGTTLTANTIGAFTLGGTVAGGGNQINNVIIGNSTPLAGSFTSVNATSITNSGLTSGRVIFANTSGLLSDSSNLAWNGTALGVIGTAPNQVNFTTTAIGSDLFRIQPQASGTGVYLQATDYNQTAYAPMGFYATSYGFNVGNVGIGVTSPLAKLHVKGSGTSGQVTSSFILENASSGTGGMDITGSAGASRWRFLYGGGPSTGTNALTESMCILTEGAGAGRVGIGTDAPTTPLTVKGGSNIAIKVISDSGSGTTATLYGGANAGVRYGALTLNRSDTSAITTYISGDPTDSSYFAGKLGIGQTSPSAKIDVATTTAGYAGIFTNTNAASDSNGILIKAGSVSTEYSLRVATQTDSATLFTVKGNGNVGIGTSSPAAKLSVTSTSLVDGIQITTADVQYIKFLNSSTKNWGFATTNLAASDFGIYQATSNGGDPISAGTARLYFDGSGNVLVGTTSVSATSEKVSIQSNSTPNLILRSTGNPSMRFYNSSDNAVNSCQINYYSGTSLSFETIPAIPITFLTTNTERMRLDTNGMLAINYGSLITGGLLMVSSNGTKGSLLVSNDDSVKLYSLGTGTVTCSGGVLGFTSDERIKIDDGNYSGGLNAVLNITPKYFYYKNSEGNKDEIKGRELGFFAQNIQQTCGFEVVHQPEDPDALLGIHDRGVMAVLVSAIKEQQALIESMAAKLKDAGVAGF